jgi:hypothetical protein
MGGQVIANLKRMTMIGIGPALAGCLPLENPPLFYAQRHTFGVGLHGSAGEQSANLVLGYKGSDVAIVPVTARDRGGVIPICALSGGKRDAFSVFGYFQGDANVSPTLANAGLNSFFTTGIAADTMAQAFNATREGKLESRAMRAPILANEARALSRAMGVSAAAPPGVAPDCVAAR